MEKILGEVTFAASKPTLFVSYNAVIAEDDGSRWVKAEYINNTRAEIIFFSYKTECNDANGNLLGIGDFTCKITLAPGEKSELKIPLANGTEYGNIILSKIIFSDGNVLEIADKTAFATFGHILAESRRYYGQNSPDPQPSFAPQSESAPQNAAYRQNVEGESRKGGQESPNLPADAKRKWWDILIFAIGVSAIGLIIILELITPFLYRLGR